MAKSILYPSVNNKGSQPFMWREDTLNQALHKYIKYFIFLKNDHWKIQVGKDLGRSQVVIKLGYEIRSSCSGLYPVRSRKFPKDIECSVLGNFCYLTLSQGGCLLWFISSLTFLCFSLCLLSLRLLPYTADSWQSLALSLYNLIISSGQLLWSPPMSSSSPGQTTPAL